MKIGPVIFGAVLALICIPPTLADQSVVLLTSEYPPYHSETLPNKGILTQIVNEAFVRSGYTVAFQFKPFARTLQEGKTGRADGILSLWYSDERAKDFLFSDPLPANRIGFFALRKKQINYRNLSDLVPYRIGVVRGYDNPRELEIVAPKIETTDNDAQNIAMLVAGRLDLALIDHDTGVYMLRKNHPQQAADYTWLEPVVEERLQYIGFSKKAEGYKRKQQAFNRGLSELRSLGRIKEILHEHDYALPR